MFPNSVHRFFFVKNIIINSVIILPDVIWVSSYRVSSLWFIQFFIFKTGLVTPANEVFILISICKLFINQNLLHFIHFDVDLSNILQNEKNKQLLLIWGIGPNSNYEGYMILSKLYFKIKCNLYSVVETGLWFFRDTNRIK